MVFTLERRRQSIDRRGGGKAQRLRFDGSGARQVTASLRRHGAKSLMPTRLSAVWSTHVSRLAVGCTVATLRDIKRAPRFD